jgi:hypothetical protein
MLFCAGFVAYIVEVLFLVDSVIISVMIYLNMRLFTHWCLRRGPGRSAALRQHFTDDPLSIP